MRKTNDTSFPWKGGKAMRKISNEVIGQIIMDVAFVIIEVIRAFENVKKESED